MDSTSPAKESETKWRGKETKHIAAPVEKVWEVLADFCGIAKRFPQLFSSSECIDGTPNEVGCLRLVTGPHPTLGLIKAKERLLSVDHEKHVTTYSIEEINIVSGCESYRGTIQVEGAEESDVTWSMEVNPMKDVSEEEFVEAMTGTFSANLNTLDKTLTA